MRRRKAIIMLVSVIAAVCLGAAGIFAYLGHVAHTEGEIADQQAKLCREIAERTMTELPAAFADEPQALVYIQQAVDNARSSLEELGLDDTAESGQPVTGG
jgi:flagellar basal body-associated protein FliL